MFERPLTYTAYGSYNELIAFIEGYHVGHSPRDTKWVAFTGWLQAYMDAGDGRLLIRFRKRFNDDLTALQALHMLYNNFLQSQDASASLEG